MAVTDGKSGEKKVPMPFTLERVYSYAVGVATGRATGGGKPAGGGVLIAMHGRSRIRYDNG